ncbi:hypothetical protein Slala03_66030 [Streptomyces lavendulae subsp. lavendulae]|nr:hypothetical protein Slala03_66030 [Streptomyces lavendulae subsp. lavendulae]
MLLTDLVEVTSADELGELLGEPTPGASVKVRSCLHEHDRQWLAASPLCVVATSGADGSCDASPKGDPAGFTLVLDDKTIAIPERPGNRRADGFRNILTNPHVGLLYLIPGRPDTLRINGRARLLRPGSLVRHRPARCWPRPTIAVRRAWRSWRRTTARSTWNACTSDWFHVAIQYRVNSLTRLGLTLGLHITWG